MKKITKFNILNTVLIILYIVIIFLDVFIDITNIPNNVFWFILFLFMYGCSILSKSIRFKSDSSLWLGITMISVAITYIIIHYLGLKLEIFYPMFLISPIIGSLFVGLIFKDVLQLKVILYIGVLFVILMLFSLKFITILQAILILICLYTVLIVCMHIFSKHNFS